MYKKLTGYFLQGLFYLAPLAVTVYIVYKTILFFDRLVYDVVHIDIPGIGILIMIVGITLLGFLTNLYLARPLIALVQAILERIPIIKELYFPLKEIFNSVAGKNKKFSKPVLAKVNPVTNVEKIGFIMQENLEDLGITGKRIAVYFPHSYAFSGELYILPAENVTPLNISASVALKFILSGGAVKQIDNIE